LIDGLAAVVDAVVLAVTLALRCEAICLTLSQPVKVSAKITQPQPRFFGQVGLFWVASIGFSERF